MGKITYHKLVRDKIPEIIKASGRVCKTEILSDSEYTLFELDEELTQNL